MRSQSRQENFSRTCWMTFQLRGTTSRVSVTSSPSLDRRVPPQKVQAAGPGINDALAGQMVGERPSARALAGEACDVGDLGGGSLGSQLVLGRRGLQLLQLQFHLVQQAGGALGARAEAVAVELLDLQLEMGDQGQVAGFLRQGGGNVGACGQQGCLERVDVIRQGGKLGVHAGD